MAREYEHYADGLSFITSGFLWEGLKIFSHEKSPCFNVIQEAVDVNYPIYLNLKKKSRSQKNVICLYDMDQSTLRTWLIFYKVL